MPLEPESARLLELIESLGLLDVSETNPDVARAMMKSRNAAMPPGPAAEVVERTIPGPASELRVRVYRPEGSQGKLLGGLVWFHGGGFVLGDLDQADSDCRTLANDARLVVVSVDYRLAPEHRFPAAVEDCYGALAWVAENAAPLGVDRARLAVGGDSAGGNLALVTALEARDRKGPPLAFQLLVYPVADLTRFDTSSYLENATGYFLTRSAMQWFASHYVPTDASAEDPRVSPLRADLHGLPPAFVVTAEHDPLRDEGEALARRLEAANVPVRLTRYDGTIHGFFTMHGFLQIGRRAMGDAAAALRTALG